MKDRYQLLSPQLFISQPRCYVNLSYGWMQRMGFHCPWLSLSGSNLNQTWLGTSQTAQGSLINHCTWNGTIRLFHTQLGEDAAETEAESYIKGQEVTIIYSYKYAQCILFFNFFLYVQLLSVITLYLPFHIFASLAPTFSTFSSILICMIPDDLSQHRRVCILIKVNLICPCRACVGARDPYCGWDLLLKKCTTLEESVRMSQWEQSITKCPVSCCLVNLSFYLALLEPLIWNPVEKISFLLIELIPSQLKLRHSLEFSLNGSYTHIRIFTTSITHLWLIIH